MNNTACLISTLVCLALMVGAIGTLIVYRKTIVALKEQNNHLLFQFSTIQSAITELNVDLLKLNIENKQLNIELSLLSSEVSRLHRFLG